MVRCKGGDKSNCQLLSHKGKPLSKPGMSYREVMKRKAQVEYFKHKRGK